jgi:hypothetical protein
MKWPGLTFAFSLQQRRNGEWKDVMDIAAANVERRRGLAATFGTPAGTPPRSRVLQEQPMYGMPLQHPVMLFAPTNEAGVMVLFAAMARDLGYAITRVQAECPLAVLELREAISIQQSAVSQNQKP